MILSQEHQGDHIGFAVVCDLCARKMVASLEGVPPCPEGWMQTPDGAHLCWQCVPKVQAVVVQGFQALRQALADIATRAVGDGMSPASARDASSGPRGQIPLLEGIR